jgi:hypothetical protein
VILAEEWQTSWFVCAVHDLLRAARLRHRAALLWRTGSTFGIDRVDWKRLGESARLAATTPAVQEELSRRGIPADVLDPEPDSLLALAEAVVPDPAAWRRVPEAARTPAMRLTTKVATDDR